MIPATKITIIASSRISVIPKNKGTDQGSLVHMPFKFETHIIFGAKCRCRWWFNRGIIGEYLLRKNEKVLEFLRVDKTFADSI